MKAIVDGDGFIYAAAFAGQTSWYEIDGHHFDGETGLRDAREFCNGKGFPYKMIKRYHSTEPVKNVLHLLRSMMTSLDRSLAEGGYQIDSIWVSPRESGRNFRYKYNPEYKANRPPKPILYQEVYDYMVDKIGAIPSPPMLETDDMVAMEAQAEDTLIVSVDKDFDQVPGIRYNWRKDEYIEIDDEDAMRNLCIQLLTGDRTDNILTDFTRLGPAKAKRILDGTEEDSGVSYMESVIAHYINHYDTEEEAIENLNRVGQQVYLLRSPDDDFKYLLEKYL